jgi:hypothetical protein
LTKAFQPFHHRRVEQSVQALGENTKQRLPAGPAQHAFQPRRRFEVLRRLSVDRVRDGAQYADELPIGLGQRLPELLSKVVDGVVIRRRLSRVFLRR